MNPIVLDISLFNNFNSVWLEIGINAGSAFDNIKNSISQLFSKIVDTVNAIQVLQDELGGLNDNFAALGQHVKELSIAKKDTGINAGNVAPCYSNRGEDAISSISHSSDAETKNSISSLIDKINTPLAHVNSTIEIVKMLGAELPPEMKAALEFSEGAGSIMEVVGMFEGFELLESLLEGVGAALLAAGSGPLGWILGAGAMLTGGLYAMREKLLDIAQQNRDTEEARQLSGQFPNMQVFRYSDGLNMQVPNDDTGYSEAYQAMQLKDFYEQIQIPFVPVVNPEEKNLREQIDKVKGLALYNAAFDNKPVDQAALNKEIDKIITNSKLPAFRFDHAAATEYRLPTDTEWYKFAGPSKPKDFLRLDDQAFFYPQTSKVAKTSLIPSANNNGPKSKEAAGTRGTVVLNFTRPMIGNFTINVKDSKEGVKNFKRKVEEALLEIIHSINAPN